MKTGLLDQLRDFALTFDGTLEEYPWGPQDVVFKAPNRKIFVICGESEDGTVRASVKLTPEESEEALTLPFVSPAPYLARNHWVRAEVTSPLELEILLGWVARSHELVAAKPKRAAQRANSQAGSGPESLAGRAGEAHQQEREVHRADAKR